MNRLRTGDSSPVFEAGNQDGRIVRSADFSGRKLFIYFYPKANTSGWTTQAQAVRDALPHLESFGVAVVGISPDPPARQKQFDDKYQLGFPLLCDEDHRIARDYGVWGEKKMYGRTSMGIIRSAFLIDETGRIAHAWYDIKPKETIPELLKALSGCR